MDKETLEEFKKGVDEFERITKSLLKELEMRDKIIEAQSKAINDLARTSHQFISNLEKLHT